VSVGKVCQPTRQKAGAMGLNFPAVFPLQFGSEEAPDSKVCQLIDLIYQLLKSIFCDKYDA
jgi:hypothetical protein